MLDNNDTLKYQLETLASNDRLFFDSPEFEVSYESNEGVEVFATVSCIELAQRSLARIVELENAFIGE